MKQGKIKEKEEHYYEYLFLLFAILVFCDRILKTFVYDSCFSVFCIKRALNTGAAFGILPGMNWFFIAVAVLIIGAIILFIGEFRGISKLGLIFVAAGTAANMIDRIFFSSVIDLFSVFGSASFNFADICNLAGAIMLVIGILKEKNKPKKP